MGFFKAAIKAVQGDMLGATSEMLPDAIKDQGKEVIQETAADYLESRDIKGVGKRMFNNTLTRLAGNAKPPKDSISQSLPQDEKAFMVFVNNEQYGPFNTDEMKQLVEGNEIDKDTLVWQEGMDNWQPASQVVPTLFIPAASMPSAPPAPPKPPTIPVIPTQTSEPQIPISPKVSLYAIIENEQHGPYDEVQFKRLIENQLVDANTLVWQEGSDNWQPAEQVVAYLFGRGSQSIVPPSPQAPSTQQLQHDINHIDVPEGTECLDEDFDIDEKVSSITLPSTLKELQCDVVSYKKHLKNIDFSKVTQLMTITENCFLGCTSLEEIILPEGVKTIEYNAFGDCSSLSRIVFPSTLKKCSLLSEDGGLDNLVNVDFSMVSHLKTIPEYCFIGCKSLEEIVIPEGVEEIEYAAFERCSSLRKIVFPSTLRKISNFTEDSGLDNLVCVDFSKVTELKTIPDNCFMGCKSLEEIIIPEGVTKVDEDAFKNCTNLRRIIIPSTLKDLDNIPTI